MVVLSAGVFMQIQHSVLYNLFFIIFVTRDENLVRKTFETLHWTCADFSCDAGNFGKTWSACGQPNTKHTG